MKVLLIVCVFAAIVLASVRFDGHKVIRVLVEREDQLEQLNKLQEDLNLDIWSGDSVLNLGWNDIRVASASQEEQIREIVPQVTTIIEDVQPLIDAQTQKLGAGWFDSYHRYAEIVAYLQNVSSLYPNLATFVPSIGLSVEGRNIPAIVISGSPSNNKIWFNGGQHAREWIGPATVMYIVHHLLSEYGKDERVTKIVDEVEFTIVPMVNPDGYEYTWTTNRLWRKNRKRNNDGSYGVDLNRNWDDHWGGAGSSSNPSSDTYHGTGPFSEPESKATSNYLSQLFPNVLAAIDFHSYSQLVLRPYGWTETLCPDNAALKKLGDGVRDAIYSVHKKDYISERSIDLYITTGTASDWFYQEGVWGAYTIELRDTGRYGFQLPPAEIIPTGQEIFHSMLFFVDHVLKNHPSMK